MKTTSLKPCSLKLRAANSISFMKYSLGSVIVPGQRMCSVGGSIFPSGT